MLVITRKAGEAFVIKGIGEIKILDVVSTRGEPVVKVGIEIPKSIKVLRSELEDWDDD